MENLSPSRIQPLSPGDQKGQDPARPKKLAKSPAPSKVVPPPPVEGESEDRHQLDELA